MKTTSIFLTAILASAISFQAMAQLTYGVKLGLNGNSIHQNYKNSDGESALKMRLGFHLGATVDYAFTDALSFQSGLLYSMKGTKFDLEEGMLPGVSVEGYSRTTLNYLEIPLHVAYKINDFQIYAGPYLAYCLGGKHKWDYKTTVGAISLTSEGDAKIKSFLGKVKSDDLGAGESAVNALDLGLNFGVGYKIGAILINAGYSLGMGNLSPKMDVSGYDRADFKENNRVLSLSVSYFLGQ
ncbi:MAG: porin family protein [Salinivirgaceae bacterium]|nr:porin family protein [Salinivirgaceae bacterium]MDY0280261.1 porin family protein [Salinivirgaceae bacterium]